MRSRFLGNAATLVMLLLTGCDSSSPKGSVAAPDVNQQIRRNEVSDPERVRAADISILFVGNSHTNLHNVPDLVCKMIEFLQPHKKAYAHLVFVQFLEDVAMNPRCKEEIESRPWTHVVLQAQKISMSGRVEYSRQEAIDIAKLAKDKGARVIFFAEWGRKGVAEEGPRTEKIYQEMARAAEVEVAPIGRAWDLALARRPELPLHAADGNHQSATGAFLTACVLVGRLTGEIPKRLASFPHAEIEAAERSFLAKCANELEVD